MKKGAKITVVKRAVDVESTDPVPKTRFIFRLGIVRSWNGGRITYDWIRQWKAHADYGKVGGTETVARSAEGTLWARGWDGAAVEAFKVAVALS